MHPKCEGVVSRNFKVTLDRQSSRPVLEEELEYLAVPVEAGGVERQPLLHRLYVDELGELLQQDLHDVLLPVVGGDVEGGVLRHWVYDGTRPALCL